MPISVAIESPSGAPVSDVYLVVNSYPSGVAGGVPTGKVKILIHHAGRLESNEPVTATWTPETTFGTSRLDLTLDYTVANAGIGTTISNMTLAP